MKKLFTLFLLILTAFTLKTKAQTATCSADFSFAISGLSVNFTPVISSSLSNNHNYWRFGDGSISSDVSPVHLYSSAGTYTVTHIYYRTESNYPNAVCIDSVQKRVEFPAATTCNLHASFSFERDATQSNKVYFHNLSTAANDIKIVRWSFGDGTYSYDFNASHVYATSGVYTVCLTILNSTNTATACVRDTCAQIQIQVPQTCNLIASFAWYADTLHQSKIHFGNLSSHFEAGDSIHWSFGDGSYSADINPTHIYSQPGTYNVCIRIQKKSFTGATPCVKEICKQVVVLSECRLEANFSSKLDSVNHKVYFTNTSTPLSSVIYFQWNFGDGTSSTSMNPDHIYAHTGVYNVCLRIAASSTCYREICKTIEVREPEINCQEISKFNFTRSTVNCLEFKFIPVNQNPNWQYHWSFGDGTGSNDMTPSHVYDHSGNYTVFLTVYKSANCVSTSYKLAETGACFSCNNIWVKYEYKRESSTSNKIYFHALSNYPILTQSWTITKLSIGGYTTVTLTQNNPYYIFTEPGDYRVCIRAITYGQCVKEYCEVIHISSPNEACTLQAYPNPTTNQVTVSVALTSPEIIHVYIYNSLNILLKQRDQQGFTGNNIVTTNIETLIPGWYTIKVIYGNRVCYSRFQKI